MSEGSAQTPVKSPGPATRLLTSGRIDIATCAQYSRDGSNSLGARRVRHEPGWGKPICLCGSDCRSLPLSCLLLSDLTLG
jgi:hypothetical protein